MKHKIEFTFERASSFVTLSASSLSSLSIGSIGREPGECDWLSSSSSTSSALLERSSSSLESINKKTNYNVVL